MIGQKLSATVKIEPLFRIRKVGVRSGHNMECATTTPGACFVCGKNVIRKDGRVNLPLAGCWWRQPRTASAKKKYPMTGGRGGSVVFATETLRKVKGRSGREQLSHSWVPHLSQ